MKTGTKIFRPQFITMLKPSTRIAKKWAPFAADGEPTVSYHKKCCTITHSVAKKKKKTLEYDKKNDDWFSTMTACGAAQEA